MRSIIMPPSNRGDLLVNDYQERGLSPLTPQDMDVSTGRGILVHNKLYLHNYQIEGFHIIAPNLKQARKIFKRILSDSWDAFGLYSYLPTDLYEAKTIGTYIPSPHRK